MTSGGRLRTVIPRTEKPRVSGQNHACLPSHPVTVIVTKTPCNKPDRVRQRETPRSVSRGQHRQKRRPGTGRDSARLAHNPEVAGSNPAPATNFRSSRPFPSWERAFCVSSTVARRVAEAALRAAWRRDGGDGVARDETAWTWWTLPPAIAGCLAQKYRRRTGVRASPVRTRTHAGLRLGGASRARAGEAGKIESSWSGLVRRLFQLAE